VCTLRGPRRSLTAVVPGTTITPTTLDPALASITVARTGTNGDRTTTRTAGAVGYDDPSHRTPWPGSRV
jgi:hypothetical protein